MKPRLRGVMLGDILVEVGGRFPWDAWMAVSPLNRMEKQAPEPGDDVTLLRMFGASTQRRVEAEELGVRWRRARPSTLFSQLVYVVRDSGWKGNDRVEVRVSAVSGDGALVLVFDPRWSPANVFASEDAGEAIAVAEDVASFRLPPLDQWQAWMPWVPAAYPPRHRGMWSDGRDMGLLGPLDQESLETYALSGFVGIKHIPEECDTPYHAMEGEYVVGKYAIQEEAYAVLQERLEAHRQ